MGEGQRIDTGSRVVAHDGRSLTLGQQMKSGGAGSIYRIVEAAELVAKIYHPHVDHSVYERKVEAMLTLVPNLPDLESTGGSTGVREVQMAWPRLLLRDQRRRFLGFAMPLLDFKTSAELELVMQERQARAEGLPTGLGARLTLAANLAGVIAELHRQAHYVVDLKPVNLRFYRRTLHVTMLDCDGCSIAGKGERFRAPQFTPEYLAPEFHARGLGESDEETQDRFALAVVAFQLLNFGIHPFTGQPASDAVPTDVPGRIAKRCYAYGIHPNPSMRPSPASGHAAIPADLRAMFDRAFEGAGSTRPSAAEWRDLLHAYGQRSTGKLVTCASKAKTKHEHFGGVPCATCARTALIGKAARAAQAAPRPRGPTSTRHHGGGKPVYAQPTAAPVNLPVKWPWKLTALIGGVGLVVVVVATIAADYSRKDKATSSWGPGPSMSPAKIQRELASRRATAAAEKFEEVLLAAQGSDKDKLVEAIHRLPSHLWETKSEPECVAAVGAWREKTGWTADVPFFAEDSSLRQRSSMRKNLLDGVAKSSNSVCDDLYWMMSAILRTQELCQIALAPQSSRPEAAACREHQVVEAGVEVLRRKIIWDASTHPFVWEYMAQSFVIADDNVRAYRAFVASQLFYRRIRMAGFRPLLLLGEGWLRQRAEILRASAHSKVLGWYGESTPPEVAAQMTANWPDAWASDENSTDKKHPKAKPTRRPRAKP